MKLVQMCMGIAATNCYLLTDAPSGKALIVDPADHAEQVSQRLRELGTEPMAILLTHGHFDHIGAASELAAQYGIPICLLEGEEVLAADPSLNASLHMLRHAVTCQADRLFHPGEQVEIGPFSFQVIASPGHTAGSACYYFPSEKILFSGDTLFCGSVGRTDLPTGSGAKLRRSCQILMRLPEDTVVAPGHGESTTIGYEKKYNPYCSVPWGDPS